MSRPSMRTTPEVGRSRPPRICSSVVLPEPDAPTMAMRSAGATRSVTPRSTSRVSGPWRKFLQTASAVSTGSVMTQRLGGCGARGAPGRIQGREHAEHKGDRAHPEYIEPLDVSGQLAHEIHARIQELRVQQALQSTDQRLEIVRHGDAERRAA